MNKDYLLSVVIPTKNRYDCLERVLKLLIQICPNDVEIIIQDNSDNNKDFLIFLETIDSSNIFYYYDTKKKSQTENSEDAISHATGRYITYIGDDDIITRSLIYVVRYMSENGIDCCTFDCSVFRWKKVIDNNPNLKSFEIDYSGKVRRFSSMKALKKNLNYGMQQIKNLPRVYHGVVSKKVMDELRDKIGCYFPGPSPDMANAVSVCLNCNNYVYFGFPLLVDGFSFNSAGGKGLRREHKGSLKDSGQLPEDVEEKWNPQIPKIWLGATVWAESAMEALEKNGKQDLIKYMDYYYVYNDILIYFPEYKNEVKPFYGRFITLKILKEMIKKIFRKMTDVIFHRKKHMENIRISTIEQALDFTDSVNKQDNRFIKKVRCKNV